MCGGRLCVEVHRSLRIRRERKHTQTHDTLDTQAHTAPHKHALHHTNARSLARTHAHTHARTHTHTHRCAVLSASVVCAKAADASSVVLSLVRLPASSDQVTPIP